MGEGRAFFFVKRLARVNQGWGSLMRGSYHQNWVVASFCVALFSS